MPINYKFTYRRNGKHIFVPNDACIRRGKDLIDFCSGVRLPSYFFHYRKGGHVAALHKHLKNHFFFRIDLQNFFYAIARNRVAKALHGIGYPDFRDCAKWSCVKNPYGTPGYALPIGFVQSPLLATLVLLPSPIVAAIDIAAQRGVFVSIYFDDLIGSSADEKALADAYAAILDACSVANLPFNPAKLVAPRDAIAAFNCDLSHGVAKVSQARLDIFFQGNHSMASIAAFEAYRDRVASQNF